MDPVAISILAMVLSPVLGVASILIGSAYNRRNSKDTNEIGRFEAFMQAAEARIKRLEDQVHDLEESKVTQAREIAKLTEDNRHLGRINAAQNRYIKKLLAFITHNLPEIERKLYDPDFDDIPFVDQSGVLRPNPPVVD